MRNAGSIGAGGGGGGRREVEESTPGIKGEQEEVWRRRDARRRMGLSADLDARRARERPYLDKQVLHTTPNNISKCSSPLPLPVGLTSNSLSETS